MRFPSFNFRLNRRGHSYRVEFLVFSVPQEKFGHYTALVYHPPKAVYRVVVCRFGRMAKEIANAELLGEIRMRRPYAWDEVEEATNGLVNCNGEYLFTELRRQNQDLQGKDVVPVAVYLVKVETKRKGLLFDGDDGKLPPGYLTHYVGKV